jgi:uncharacterized protein
VLLRDPVHGLVTFERDEEAIVLKLLDTPEVQRLRRIQQLGLTCLAFPGAVHTRFAHAIGAAHVMTRFVARMREVHHSLPFWQQLTSERARDAIAAALLHDVGHGPFSHLFEDALAAAQRFANGDQPGAPSTLHHEDWTERILLDDSTEVHRVLSEQDPDLPRRVAGLIRGRHPLPYLACAVSGTFDVDRCDYLLRDAHGTGVRHGEYDLPWLFRSLRLDHSADAPGLAIDGTKGLSAIESFILARLFMFQQVYFHKSTRAAECLIRMILARAASQLRDGARLSDVPPGLLSLAQNRNLSLGQYLELDDGVLLETFNCWRNSKDPILADLCQRLRGRDLFRTIELFGENTQPKQRAEAYQKVRAIASEAGLDPDFYTELDLAIDTPYSDDSTLAVLFPRSAPRRPAEVSFVLDRLRDETLTRVRLIFASELKERVSMALFGEEAGSL